uniref:Abnormal spindle-like microcephaly-associated protein ASH domain-containing protein n=2 Tax=Lutzomyia longipalpis TaxID=7200 RepID=A0A1B0CU28_LUTLO
MKGIGRRSFSQYPEGRRQRRFLVDYEGFSGFFVPHNASYASDQFSLGALCHKQSEAVNNMIRADSPTPAATCMLSSTVNSVTSAYSEAPSAAGRTYTAEPKETDVDSLIEKLNLSESTNKILANMLKKEPKKNIRKSPLDDITAQEVNLNSTEGTINESTLQSGKENRQSDKEYEDFCRFKTKSPRRAGSNSKLSLSTESAHEKSKRRSSSSRLEPFAEQTRGTRKRSRSSVYIQSDPAPSVVECRRGKSPGNTEKTRMNSDSIDPTSASDRMFIFNTPIDSGKMSLPNYGLIKGDSKSPGSTGLTRTTSQLSTASEFNHREGYLPLKATHGELSWGSVRLRTSITKNIQIKNTSAKRLTLRAVIDGPGFQFGSAELPHMTITLQPQECRGMWIVFCPTIKGPAVGKLIFKPPLADSTSRVIPLYGYGGHATVTIEGLQQGPVGSKFLPIGDIKNPMRTFEKIIRVHNKGSLTAFASVNVENTRTDQRYFTTSVSVNPSRLIVPPSCSTNIKIQFSPQREELKKLLKMQRGTDVIVIANLVVITGDEPTRHRMKKLMKTMPNHALMSSTVLSGLWNSFPKEQDLENLEELRENSMAITDLAQGFRSIEIALTINNERADETVLEASGWMADFEETVLFRTITSGEEPDEHEVTHDEVEVVSVQPQEIVWKSHDAACKRLTVKVIEWETANG